MSWLFSENNSLQTEIVSFCSSVVSSTLHADRVDALSNLVRLSHSHPMESGSSLIRILPDLFREFLTQQKDISILRTLTQICMNLFIPPHDVDPDDIPCDPKGNPYFEINIDAFLQSPKHLSQLLQLIPEPDFEIRYNFIQILSVFLMARNHKVSSMILSVYDAVNQIVELVSDSRDYIQSAMLVLLIELTKSDASIQKIVAFTGAEKIFQIIEENDGIVGGQSTRDCLAILRNLFGENKSNQKIFVEFGNLSQMASLLIARNWSNEDQVEMIQLSVDLIHAACFGVCDEADTQSALAVLCESLMEIIANGAMKRMESLRRSRTPVSGVPTPTAAESSGASGIEALKLQCLSLICLAAWRHEPNQNLLADLDVTMRWVDHPNVAQKRTHVFEYLLNMSLNTGSPSSSPSQESWSDPSLSYGACVALCGMFDGNSSLQQEYCLSLSQDASTLSRMAAVLSRMVTSTIVSVDDFDPIHVWVVCRLVAAMMEGNDGCKELLLKKPLRVSSSSSSSSNGNENVMLVDVVLKNLLGLVNNRDDQRKQLGLLLILVTWCNNFEEGIKVIFTSDRTYFWTMVSLATSGGRDDVHVRGLATFVIGLCLEYARDLTVTALDSGDVVSLSDIISDMITVETFKSNLEFLRQSDEYQRAFGVVRELGLDGKRNEKNTIKLTSAFASRVLSISSNYETLVSPRLSCCLYTIDFVMMFEEYFDGIDKRMLQVLSRKKPGMPSHARSPPISHMNGVNPSGGMGMQSSHTSSVELESSRQENARLLSRIAELEEALRKSVVSPDGDGHAEEVSSLQDALEDKSIQINRLTQTVMEKEMEFGRLKTKFEDLQIAHANSVRQAKEFERVIEAMSGDGGGNDQGGSMFSDLQGKFRVLKEEHDDLLVLLGEVTAQNEQLAMHVQQTQSG